MSESEVARLRREIALSYQACLRALESPGVTAPHAFITARMEKISDCQVQLVDLVGADAATRITAQTIDEAGEQDSKVTSKEDRRNMKRYIPQKGDICWWPYQKVNYAQEYDGHNWSKPVALNDVASADPALYARVMRPDAEPERYEIVHNKKRHRKTYYREKSQLISQNAK